MSRAWWFVLFGAGAVSIAPCTQASGEELHFIACPIYRDTDAGRKSGCWLADAAAGRYDITRSPTKPDWNRQVLVEGMVSQGAPDTCGGVVLDPVRVSVLPGRCPRMQLPPGAWPGVRFALPVRNIRPLHEPRVKPDRPYMERNFSVPFDFGSAFVVYQLADYYLNQAVLYAYDIQARRIEITGWAATSAYIVSGQPLVESTDLARRRAEVVARWFTMSGFAPEQVEIKVADSDAPAQIEGADGLHAPSRRRVDIRVVP